MSRPPILELPRGARSYRLSTARGDFAVHDAGEPRRGTALLVPGFTGSKEDFLALLEPLALAGFRAVAVDGRGQYETGGPRDEAAYAQDELARDVIAQARALGGPVHMVGHSLGGLIARAAVLRGPGGEASDETAEPAPFASLTLLSSGPAAVCAAQQARLEMLLGALPSMGMEALWQAMRELDPPEAPGEEASGPLRDFLHRRWLANVPEQLSATGRQLLHEPDRVGELAGVPLRMHVLSGERDYAWPVPLMDAMAVRLGARRTVIAGTEHSPNAESPQRTAQALADFWA